MWEMYGTDRQSRNCKPLFWDLTFLLVGTEMIHCARFVFFCVLKENVWKCNKFCQNHESGSKPLLNELKSVPEVYSQKTTDMKWQYHTWKLKASHVSIFNKFMLTFISFLLVAVLIDNSHLEHGNWYRSTATKISHFHFPLTFYSSTSGSRG